MVRFCPQARSYLDHWIYFCLACLSLVSPPTFVSEVKWYLINLSRLVWYRLNWLYLHHLLPHAPISGPKMPMNVSRCCLPFYYCDWRENTVNQNQTLHLLSEGFVGSQVRCLTALSCLSYLRWMMMTVLFLSQWGTLIYLLTSHPWRSKVNGPHAWRRCSSWKSRWPHRGYRSEKRLYLLSLTGLERMCKLTLSVLPYSRLRKRTCPALRYLKYSLLFAHHPKIRFLSWRIDCLSNKDSIWGIKTHTEPLVLQRHCLKLQLCCIG